MQIAIESLLRKHTKWFDESFIGKNKFNTLDDFDPINENPLFFFFSFASGEAAS
jgi:hypothetical protein